MATSLEIDAMRRAITVSALGLGTASPNPRVGWVILDAGGRIAGTGFHQRKGRTACRSPRSRGGRRRRGRRHSRRDAGAVQPRRGYPACRQLLLDAGIRRVVASVIDPTSLGAGGAVVLAEAGVDVETDVLTDETLTVLRPWLTATTTRRPYVTWAFTPGTGDKADPPQPLIAQLRQRNDLVFFPDRVEEGIPNGHGKDRLRVPQTTFAADDPTTTLADAFTGGARSLLLVGDTGAARAMLAEDLVDQLFVVTRRCESAGDRDALTTTYQLPDYDHQRQYFRTTR